MFCFELLIIKLKIVEFNKELRKSSSFVPLEFYGMTKDPETKEFIIVTEFADKGSLRDVLSNFNKLFWRDKIINCLHSIACNPYLLHNLDYCHRDFHSGNILRGDRIYLSDFGLSKPADVQRSDGKVYGVLPFIAPEVLNGKPYTPASDIYSFGIIMTELSSGKPPFHDKKHD